MFEKQDRGWLFRNVVGTFKNPVFASLRGVWTRKGETKRLPPCRLAISGRKNGFYGVLLCRKGHAVFSTRNRGFCFLGKGMTLQVAWLYAQ
jgi:hypothetical protein